MIVTFHNVTISIEAISAERAYTQLGHISLIGSWSSDTYSTSDDRTERNTLDIRLGNVFRDHTHIFRDHTDIE